VSDSEIASDKARAHTSARVSYPRYAREEVPVAVLAFFPNLLWQAPLPLCIGQSRTRRVAYAVGH
jgi:hypothetical protein